MVRKSDGEVDWKIVVAVNGSTDGTGERAREVRRSEGPKVRIEVLDCPKAGKGAAVKCAAEECLGPIVRGDVRRPEGMSEGPNEFWESESASEMPMVRKSDGTIFGFIDADLSADPDAIPGMVEKIINGEVDIVIASRWVQLRTTNRAFFRNATSWIFNLFARVLLGLKVKDAQCGLKIMNRRATELLVGCQEDGWFLDIELLHAASRRGLRVLEVPVPWTEFRYPDRKSQIRHVQDGIGALRAMLRIRRREWKSDGPNEVR